MHSLEPELRELHAAGLIDGDTAARAVALERGEVQSVFEELRAALYAGVALVMGGIGIVLERNLARIGPLTIMAVLALAAAACYASAIRTRLRAAPRSIGGDYLLLLGALIVSADLGYGEAQFHWLGADWSRHLLLLAVLHVVTAYALDSRLVLAVALTSLAGWLGVERSFGSVFEPGHVAPALALRALGCASIVFLWRTLHERLRATPPFTAVFDQFAVNLAFWAALSLSSGQHTRLAGLALFAVLAPLVIRTGLRTSEESFIVYGVVYTAVGAGILTGRLDADPLFTASALLVIVIAAAVLLWRLHARLRERAP